jgi:hypothetical protein
MDQRNKLMRSAPGAGANGRQHRSVEPRVRDQRWPSTWMALGIFIGLFTLLWVGYRTVVDTWTIVRGLALFSFVGALLPYAHSGLRMGMERLEWMLFNVLAVGPLLMSLLLWANLLVHQAPVCSEHGMLSDAKVQLPDEGEGPREVVFARHGWLEMRGEETGAGAYRLCVAKGCLGFWVVTERKVISH